MQNKKVKTPEEKARERIDEMFGEAGWKVLSRDEYAPNISAVALEEGLMNGNLEADYLLFISGKAVGVLEAKRVEIDVDSPVVEEQAVKYTKALPDWYQYWQKPLLLAYVSNGKQILFKDNRTPDAEFKPISRIHTPKEVVEMLQIPDFYAGLPALKKKGLRNCQYEAITNLEGSFREGHNKALMVLATGAGKTYTACTAAYRFLSYTPMKRVLFLVDRNNLGKQAENEFGMYRLTETGDPFNTIFTVNRLRSSNVPKDTTVMISTIQRLFSLLSGETITDVDDDDEFEPGAPIELPGNLALPHDYFDLIIIDECHRSIYGNWRAVLDYFDTAKMIGLTATPVPETIAFFNNNVVINYTLEKSIIDGVNVDCRIYRIKTRETEDGGAIREGQNVKQITRYTGKVESISNREARNYTREELNRSIVNPAQIKLILETYRDAVYTEMFNDPQREPNMDYLPKTLIFALNDAHATNIVRIAKDVFKRPEDDNTFVQKITYSAGDSNQLIREFRNDKNFRIAVTVTLVATGTDIKPLEVVMFMRDVRSEQLYTQMKGRGVRTIGDEQLRNVTPNAFSKDLFYLVDAVGVTEHEHVVTTPGEPSDPTISLETLLERIAHGNVSDDYLRTLAGRLARIHNKCSNEQREKFFALAHTSMADIAKGIYDAMEKGILPPYTNINEPNLERKALVSVIANYPEVRKYILVLAAGFVTILQPGEDELITKGFTTEEAASTTEAFEKYIAEHKDEIEALRIIYNNAGEPLTYTMLKDLQNQLLLANSKFRINQLWNNYALLKPEEVTKFGTKEEREAITNIIQLVRYGYHMTSNLVGLQATAKQYFNLWCGQLQRTITDAQKELLTKIVDYIVTNGSCEVQDIIDNDRPYAAQIITSFGGRSQADDAISSLSQFLLYRKTA